MTQFEDGGFNTGFEETPEAEFPQQQKTSALAVTSFIMSLICCCPVTTIPAPFLGLAAIIRIGGNPMLKGRGFALAGIILGLMFTLGQGGFAYWNYKNYYVVQMAGPADALSDAFNGDYSTYDEQFFVNPTDDEVAAFAEELRSRYGNFVGITYDRMSYQPDFQDMMNPVQDHPYLIEFENETVSATIELSSTNPNSGEFYGTFKFGAITIHDEERGDVSLPPGSAPASSPNNGGDPDDADTAAHGADGADGSNGGDGSDGGDGADAAGASGADGDDAGDTP